MTTTPDLGKLSIPELEAAFAAADAAHNAFARKPNSEAGRAALATVDAEQVDVEDEREVRAVLLGRAREIVLELNRRRAQDETSS